jgi:NTP pyrophosphatase (non-canonical NTP hydrolase)
MSSHGNLLLRRYRDQIIPHHLLKEELQMTSDEATTINDLKNLVQGFIDDRDWRKYHKPKEVAISIAIEASELLEVFQWLTNSEVEKMLTDKKKLDSLKEELADILIYCLSLANVTNTDIACAVTDKIEKNKTKYPVEQIKGNYKKYTELRQRKHE